ncbi:zinc transporter ZupT [Rubripirellula obstinata]|uniref:Zinc transporter ZupT n=1 Tax=Rubripirellula obstinata TaxID=406547 RepID=A0A5B1CNF4_9BACT|nr:ZIP family metal transporter [Rubripirellula obstinata]KAA1261892.1 zinc transporter ZupT [Rubripirellula obstinata]
MNFSPLALLFVYCVFVVAASVLGGRLPSVMRMTHVRTQMLMSFVGGLMLAIASLHLLPHAISLISPSAAGMSTLVGIIGMFLLLRVFHAHAHTHCVSEPDHSESFHSESNHSESNHVHDHSHDNECSHIHGDDKRLGWLGMLFGLGLHTLIDGVALAASVAAETAHGSWLGLAGLGTFLAVALHKPLDAFAITSVMKQGGWPISQQNMVNALFAMACPLGALLFYFGTSQFAASDTALGYGLALSAGFFICIALADLLPEVAFHDHDRGKLTAALLLGITLAIAIENLPGHSHQHELDGSEIQTQAVTPLGNPSANTTVVHGY